MLSILSFCGLFALLFAASSHGQACTNQTDVVALVRVPFADLDDVQSRLNCLLTIYLESNDFKGVFLSVYVQVTFAVIDKIDDGNYFANNVWVGQYLVNFANMYRERVFQLFTNDPALPCVWKEAFEPDRNLTLIFQDLLLGMNAHIDYDLAIAISATGMSPNRRQKYSDHNLVNNVLHTVYQTALTTLVTNYEPAMNKLMKDIGPLVSIAMDLLLRLTRQAAWDNASLLNLATHRSKLLYKLYLDGLDIQASLVGKAVKAVQLDKGLFLAMKDLEGDDPMDQFCVWMPAYCLASYAG